MNDPGRRVRRWGVPAVVAGLLLAWVAAAWWLFPELVTRAYRGDGLAWLADLMGGRGGIPLEEYLGDLAANALRAATLLFTVFLVTVGWAARGLDATDPWLRPAPLRDLAVLRIVAVGLLLVLMSWPGAPNGAIALDPGYQRLLALSSETFSPTLALQLLLPGVGRPGSGLLDVVWWAGLAGGVLGLVGACGRFPLLVAAWSISALVAHGYSFGEYHHPEALHAIALWLVALAPSTRALSVDAFRARRREVDAAGRFVPLADPPSSPHARWPLTLLGLLYALTYVNAAVEKLILGGVSWFGSETLAYHVAVDATRTGIPLGIWFATHPGLLAPMSYGAWAIEALFPLALVSATLAPLMVAAAVAMHAGIFVIHGPPFLQHVVLLPVSFVRELRLARERWLPAAADLEVVYDGGCDLCMRSMAALETLDGGARLTFVDLDAGGAESLGIDPLEALARMHVVDGEGRVRIGFFAFRRIARRLPLLWPALPLLHAPFASRIGPLVYDAVARRRRRRGCRIHPGGGDAPASSTPVA